eukprot:4151962-Amphidinium_carterae.1
MAVHALRRASAEGTLSWSHQQPSSVNFALTTSPKPDGGAARSLAAMLKASAWRAANLAGKLSCSMPCNCIHSLS